MIATGVLTAVSFIVIAAKLGPVHLKKLLGYEIQCDIASHVFFVGLGAISGTFSGVMGGIVAALVVSGVLRVARNVLGYSKREDGKWKDYHGKWTIAYLTTQIIQGFDNLVETVTSGISKGIEESKAPAANDSEATVVAA